MGILSGQIEQRQRGGVVVYFLQKKLKKEEKAKKKLGAKFCKKTFSVSKDNAFMIDRLAGQINLTALS